MLISATFDPDFLDATDQNNLNILGVGHHKSAKPEGVLHSRAAKLLQVHAHGKLVNTDAFEHVSGLGVCGPDQYKCAMF